MYITFNMHVLNEEGYLEKLGLSGIKDPTHSLQHCLEGAEKSLQDAERMDDGLLKHHCC